MSRASRELPIINNKTIEKKDCLATIQSIRNVIQTSCPKVIFGDAHGLKIKNHRIRVADEKGNCWIAFGRPTV